MEVVSLAWGLVQQCFQHQELEHLLVCLLGLRKSEFAVYSHQVQLAMAFVAGFAVGSVDLVVGSHSLEEGQIGQGVEGIHVQVGDTSLADHQMVTFLETLDQEELLYPILQAEEGKIQEVDIAQKEPCLEVVLVAGEHFVLAVEVLVGFDFEGLGVLARMWELDEFHSMISNLVSQHAMRIKHQIYGSGV